MTIEEVGPKLGIFGDISSKQKSRRKLNNLPFKSIRSQYTIAEQAPCRTPSMEECYI